MPKWGEPGDVGRVVRIVLRCEVVEGGLDVYGLPQHNDVDHDAEAVELVFLPDLAVPPQLAALVEPRWAQVIDAEIVRKVTERRLPGLLCPCCGTVTFAESPPGAHAGAVSYGPVLNAAVISNLN